MAPELAFTLAMPRPETHLFEVTLRARNLPVAEDGTVDFRMAAWTPGSYLIRDYARHVQDFAAADGRGNPVPWERVDKQTWRVRVKGGGDVTLFYRVYANELSVRTSHLDATHAYVDGTSVFMHVASALDAPATVVVKPHRGWTVDSALPEVRGKRNTFRAADYAHLADATMEIGTHRRFAFTVGGKKHRVALYGRGNEDADRVRRDLETIVKEEVAMMGIQPYGEYLFIVHLLDKAGGGLEHRDSNTSAVDRWTFAPPKRYEDFLALEAHEFFHVWNVKRLKPAAFVPYDYERETYTTLLWAMEGLTAYYDHLVLARSGLMTEERYRDYLGEMVTKLRQQPGRFKLSLEESSRLAWVKLYKQDENWINSGVSYYLKGELVGLTLDLAIRERSGGKRSLDDVMRALYERYPPESGGIPEFPKNGWKQTLEDVTGASWTPFWNRYIAGTDEVDFDRVLKVVGWKLEADRAGEGKDAAKKGEYEGPGGWTGAELKDDQGRVRVKSVIAGSPAESAGLGAGDELVAWDGHRVRDPDFVKHRLREHAPGDEVEIRFFRRDRLESARVALAEAPPEKWKIVEATRVTPAQKRARAAWLAPYGQAARAKPATRGGGHVKRKQARELVEERGE